MAKGVVAKGVVVKGVVVRALTAIGRQMNPLQLGHRLARGSEHQRHQPVAAYTVGSWAVAVGWRTTMWPSADATHEEPPQASQMA